MWLWHFATLILCFSLFLLPFCFLESFRCSFASLFNACLRYSGESTFVPSLNVKKCFKPKSMPIELSNVISESDTIGFSTSEVWTIKLTKYWLQAFLEMVAVPILPCFTFLVNTNLILLSLSFYFRNFGIWIFLCLKSNFNPDGTSNDYVLSYFDLYLGNPPWCLKNLWYALSRCPIVFYKVVAPTSYNQGLSNLSCLKSFEDAMVIHPRCFFDCAYCLVL